MKWIAASVGFTAMVNCACAQTPSWKDLSKLNDPPGKPSLRAARVATQGLIWHQLVIRLDRLTTALTRAHKDTDPVAKGVLKREIALLEVALEHGEGDVSLASVEVLDASESEQY